MIRPSCSVIEQSEHPIILIISDKTDENPTDYTHKTQSLRCCTIPVITGAEFNIMKSSPIMNDATPAAVPNF